MLSGNIFSPYNPIYFLMSIIIVLGLFFYYGIQYYSFFSRKQFVIVLYAQAAYRTHTHKHRVLSLVYSSSSSVPYLSAFFLWLFAATGSLFFRLYFPLFCFVWLGLAFFSIAWPFFFFFFRLFPFLSFRY